MKIEKIEFVKEKPYTQKVGKLFISNYYSEPDQGYWLIYGDTFLSNQEVCDNLTDENLDRYLWE